MTSIAIVGAGITGVTTAYALAKRGYAVTVYDRERYAAMQTSFANGGQLSVSNAETWTQLSTVLKGIKWMFRRDAPLLVNPKPDWHKLSWMAEFVGNIPNYEANTIETVRLALAAREHLHAWAEQENIDFDLETRGILHIYADQKGLDHATRVNRLLAEGGLQREAVSPERMRDIEPALQGDFVGGYFTPSDATGDIHKYTRGLAAACERLGVTFHYDTEVEDVKHAGQGVVIQHRRAGSGHLSVVRDDGSVAPLDEARHDGLVMCAGMHSRRLAASLGLVPPSVSGCGYRACGALGGSSPDDAEHVAAGWCRVQGRCVLQHRARASRLDTVSGHCRNHWRENRGCPTGKATGNISDADATRRELAYRVVA